ncbi:PilT protein domain protein [Thermoanaerobacterium thermosaccharolyticum DSM 571]|uniref:PilT protein domain protein n=1 Tax=Thermoanaerobacterium thermosaccharolyticum (strain ATCC 7956 / DSM 571 / NCIMB 9385 / NCA 3814 / NCTC 13789 / WDCM 00135 / 2032) TaxID=580327 RepID=D9TLZ4_THETC|nr:putative toxin-antitoxin system toxin component, PIN family [Thermoanaerobacterium thermosaccharolyticum]ADL68374.1 PilT protein domain protein [Thermoanaerobacterium thermosaccharolyticum DSM 571]
MRIMIDTNVLILIFLFPTSRMKKLVDIITDQHTIVLPSYVIDELKMVIRRKFPAKYQDLDTFLSELPFEYTYTIEKIYIHKYPDIRDKKDLPVLVSAITEDVDVLITGDKDFYDLKIEKPEILTPAKFVEKYN